MACDSAQPDDRITDLLLRRLRAGIGRKTPRQAQSSKFRKIPAIHRHADKLPSEQENLSG
jgi:hypothetical protein